MAKHRSSFRDPTAERLELGIYCVKLAHSNCKWASQAPVRKTETISWETRSYENALYLYDVGEFVHFLNFY